MQNSFPNILSSDAAPWMFTLAALLAALIFAAVCRLFAGYFDAGRVEKHIRLTGGRLLESSWEPFGPGWFGTHGARIYQIVYEDKEGRIHHAHLKTSMLGGVYLTKDIIVGDTAGGVDYGSAANGRIRLEHGIPVVYYANPEDEVAVRSAQHPLAELPACNELLAENEQLKARIRKLEGDATGGDSNGTC